MTVGSMATVDSTDARLSTHEEVCKIRYEAINARLKRIEMILMVSAGFIVTTLVGIALKLPH